MREGWHGEDYLILFEDSEVGDLTRRYEIAKYVDGHQIIGLKGWDDFILRDGNDQLFTIPTVPLDPRYLAPAWLAIDGRGLVPDARVREKIKCTHNRWCLGEVQLQRIISFGFR